LIASGLTWKAASTQAQFLTRLCPRRNMHFDRAARSWNRHARSERRLPGCNRQRQCNVAPIHLEQRMGLDTHLEVQVARLAASAGLLSLPGQANELALGHAGRNGDPHGMRLELQGAVRLELGPLELERAGRAGVRLLEVDVDPR